MLVSPAEFFLESVDRAAKGKARSVVPIVGIDERQVPGAIGSAVLMEIDGGRLLVTAAHVIAEWAPVSTLYLPGASGLVMIDGVEFFSEKSFDIAVAILPDAMLTELQSFIFLKEADCRAICSLHPAYIVAVGYPATRNRARWGQHTIRNAPYMIGGMPRHCSSRKVSFGYSKRKNRTSRARQKVLGPDLWGMSGGPMFASRIGLSSELFLVGIGTDWVRCKSQVDGCSWPVLIRFIREVLRKL